LITVILEMYVNDIIVSGHDHYSIIQLKVYISSHFHIKDEVFSWNKGCPIQDKFFFALSQIKCLIDILENIC